MKKYGSLLAVLGALVVTSVAYADIPITHTRNGSDLNKEAESKLHGETSTSGKSKSTKICNGGPALVHCEVGQECNLACGDGSSASNTQKASRKTASVNTNSSDQ